MGRWIRRYKEPLLIGILTIFFLSIFVGFGSYVFISSDTRNIVAKVGRSTIPTKTYSRFYTQTLERLRSDQPSLEITRETERRLQQDVLRDLIVRELLSQAARESGIRVSPQEVSLFIASQKGFQRDGQFSHQIYYQYVMQNLGLLPKEFEKEMTKDILDAKLRNLLANSIVFTPKEAEEIFEMEKDTLSKSKDPQKEKINLLNHLRSQKSLGFLNQILFQLSQTKHIRTYLQEGPAE